MHTRIAVVEPDIVFHPALILMFQYSGRFDCVGVYETSSALLSAQHTTLQLLLLNIDESANLPLLRKQLPNVKMIVITQRSNDERVLHALASGAANFIAKGADPAQYLQMCSDVLNNNIRVSGDIARQILVKNKNFEINEVPLEVLSARENEILRLLAEGKLYKEMARHLLISIETVKRHCTNIYQKLQVNNRTEAINKFFANR